MLKIKDEFLHHLLSIVVENGVKRAKEVVSQKLYLSTYPKYPRIYYAKPNGMPSIESSLTSYGDNVPIYYKMFFTKYKGEQDIDITQISGYEEYKDYMVKSEHISSYFKATTGQYIEKQIEGISEYKIQDIAQSLIERYMYIYGDKDYNQERFNKIYQSFENCIYMEKLPLEIHIPILFTHFDFEEYQLTDRISIVKMDEDFQKSRISKTYYPIQIPSTVLESATHAFVMKGLEFRNASYYMISKVFSKPQSYAQFEINTFINTLRVATNINTGYAQLLAKPVLWAPSYEADLMPLLGTTIKNYPSYFDIDYWAYPTCPQVTLKEMEKVKEVFNKLVSTEDKKIHLASRRLHQCYMREDEADSILDATIAMEALMTDGEHGELTHKLALRMAALLKLSTEVNMDTIEIFKAVKQIYAYRSSVVHGSTKASSKREIKLPSGEPIPTLELAIKLIQASIQVLIDNPKYLNAKKIDEELLLQDER